MAEIAMRAAINSALMQEMARDERVIMIGTDIAGGHGGSSGQEDVAGGVLGITKGLSPQFGASRVIDTPIAEMGYMGMAVGAAATGLRPAAGHPCRRFWAMALTTALSTPRCKPAGWRRNWSST